MSIIIITSYLKVVTQLLLMSIIMPLELLNFTGRYLKIMQIPGLILMLEITELGPQVLLMYVPRLTGVMGLGHGQVVT